MFGSCHFRSGEEKTYVRVNPVEGGFADLEVKVGNDIVMKLYLTPAELLLLKMEVSQAIAGTPLPLEVA